jgi:hypothetical protein
MQGARNILKLGQSRFQCQGFGSLSGGRRITQGQFQRHGAWAFIRPVTQQPLHTLDGIALIIEQIANTLQQRNILRR